MCVSQPSAGQGVAEIVPKLHGAGQLPGIPLGTKPGATHAVPLQSCWRAGRGWVPGPVERATGCCGKNANWD
jgi:hypothetical protein